MKIFETHAHFDDKAFDEDRDELIASLPDMGISPVINVGADMKTTANSINLAHKYPYFYAAAGVHPSDIDCLNDEAMARLESYCDDDKVCAIGEIGLDYYWEKDEEVRARQREWFRKQLALAKKVDLPVIIHSRDACEDTLEIIREAAAQGVKGVMHCFSYSAEIAAEYVRLGFYIGVGGVVTFKNGKKLKETVERIPLDNILVETDCPYMAPEPFRGTRNDSTYLHYIVRKISGIKEITEDEVTEITAKNARKLFSKVTFRG